MPDNDAINDITGSGLEMVDHALQVLDIQDNVFAQQQCELVQSSDFTDSGLHSSPYTGSLIESQLDPSVPSDYDLAILASLENGFIEPNAMEFTFDADSPPVVALGDDEIELRSMSTPQSVAPVESIGGLNTAQAWDIVREIGNSFLTPVPDESVVVEGETPVKTEQPPSPRKPKFKRHNRSVPKGNNREGKGGKLRCTECRKVHRKCVRVEGSDACDFCLLRGRRCVMTWGEEKEKSLASPKKPANVEVPRQLPPAPEAVVSERERWRLDWMFHNVLPNGYFGNLIRNIMIVYGPTVSNPQLRLAMLAHCDWACPYERQFETFLHGSISAASKKAPSDLDETDLIATALLIMAIRVAASMGLKLRHQVPSRTVLLKWVLKLLKKLVREGNGNVSQHLFGQYWMYLLVRALRDVPYDRTDASALDLVRLTHQYFDMSHSPAANIVFDVDVRIENWKSTVSYHYTIAIRWFWMLLENGNDGRLPAYELHRTMLQDAKRTISELESSGIYQSLLFDVDQARIGGYLNKDYGFGDTYSVTWRRLKTVLASNLAITLVLGGEDVLQSAGLPEIAISASQLVLEIFKHYKAKIRMSVSGHSFNILWTATACLAHPISRVPTIVNAISAVFCFAQPWLRETIERYWSDPKSHLGEMLAMLRAVWISAGQIEGRSGDFEEGGPPGVPFWS